MHLSLTFWWKRFVLQAAVWTIGMLVGIAVVVGLVYPASRWLFLDTWQWMPFSKWLTGVLGAAPLGIMIGGLFTLYEWLQLTQAPLLKKIIVGIAVAFFFVVVVMAKGIDGVHAFVKWTMATMP